MTETNRSRGAKVACAALAIFIALSACLGAATSVGTSRAYASGTADLYIGGTIYYAGYATNWMYADGAMAYCADPSATTPSTGSYAKEAIVAPSGRSSETIADLWFGYGTPGFDASMWPSTWYDGSAMTEANYAALTHILLSDTFSSDGNFALHGCTQQFRDWCRWNVIGFDEDGTEFNPSATGRLICARAGEVPPNFDAFMLRTGSGSQLVLSFTPAGGLELAKISANETITQDNSCYSVEGAVYGIYRDGECTDEAARMTTDANGHARADGLLPGSYWVHEVSPSFGMVLDDGRYLVEVVAGGTAQVNGGIVLETPKTDPVGMLVGKVDATTNANRPQGDAGLSGAQFTVSFYAGQYATAQEAMSSGAPAAEWVFETDEDGFAYYADGFKVSGPDLYRQMGGTTAALPLGTVVIKETKAPVGYNLDDGTGGEPKASCVHITDDGTQGESVHTYNSPEVPDTVQRGDYRLMKEVPTSNDEEDQERTRIAIEGVQFQIINDSKHAVVSPDTMSEVRPGDVVTTLVTDENGFATTRDHVPSVWTAALAYGEYTVHEVIPDDVAARVKAEHGISLTAVNDWEIAIDSEMQYKPVQIVANHIPQTPIAIQKVDSTTGKTVPLACSFQLYDARGELVTYADRMNDCVIDTWTTLSSGKVTLPMKLDEGTYTLCEVQAPEGYVLGAEAVSFTVDEYRTWDDPVTVTYADTPIRGKIELSKSDAWTGDPLVGAEYCVKAAEDIMTGDGTVRFESGQTVSYITTDEDGEAAVDGLYLGRYLVYETKSPEGFALDTAEHQVLIESQGQTVPIVVYGEDVADLPTSVKILKVDSTDPEKALAGATFRIWQDEGSDGKVPFDGTFITDDNGLIHVGYLPHGAYHIEEVEAPAGYYLAEDAEAVDFNIDEQGFIGLAAEGSQFSDTLALSFKNSPTIVDIAKADLISGEELPGAHLMVTDAEGTKVDEWVSTAEAHRICGLARGEYALTETIAPEGYLITDAVAFTVAGTGEVQKVTMFDDYTKTDFSKTDVVTGEELSGAHLQVIDEDATAVAEWVTDGTTHRIDGLEPGDYALREVSAPNGYEVAEDVSFTVQATGDVRKIEMKDRAIPDTPGEDAGGDLPKTGDVVPWWIFALLVGAALCASAAFAFAYRRQGEERDDDVHGGESGDET